MQQFSSYLLRMPALPNYINHSYDDQRNRPFRTGTPDPI